MKIDPDELVDANEVAALTGLKNAKHVSVYNGRKSTGFPAPVIRKGRCVLWRRQDIEEWARVRG